MVTGTLIQAVHELSRSQGHLSTPTTEFIKRMSRTLPPGDAPTKLFALNYDVDKFNSDKLISMPGKYMVEFCIMYIIFLILPFQSPAMKHRKTSKHFPKHLVSCQKNLTSTFLSNLIIYCFSINI